jgi:hypothetical protein
MSLKVANTRARPSTWGHGVPRRNGAVPIVRGANIVSRHQRRVLMTPSVSRNPNANSSGRSWSQRNNLAVSFAIWHFGSRPISSLISVRGQGSQQGRSCRQRCLSQRRGYAQPQDVGKASVEGSWLNQFGDVVVGHGMSFLRSRSGGVMHLCDMPRSRFSPSPTSGDSWLS